MVNESNFVANLSVPDLLTASSRSVQIVYDFMRGGWLGETALSSQLALEEDSGKVEYLVGISNGKQVVRLWSRKCAVEEMGLLEKFIT